MDDEVNGENNGTGSSTLFGEINNNDGTLINSPIGIIVIFQELPQH